MDLKVELYKSIFRTPPAVRRWLARSVYEAVSKGLTSSLERAAAGAESGLNASSFLNYGYADARSDEAPLALKREHEAFRYQIQLYHHVASAVGVAGKDVLEVGSGRGGGCQYMAEYLSPASVTGVELSPAAVSFCRSAYDAPGLRFVVGDATALPFSDASFDVVINVESSHCYPSFDGFLAEAVRVLRPGGQLSWVDARFAEDVAPVERSFAQSGLEVVRESEITDSVLRSLSASSDRAERQVNAEVPRLFRGIALAASGVRGTLIYEMLASGQMRYLSKVLRKPDAAGRA